MDTRKSWCPGPMHAVYDVIVVYDWIRIMLLFACTKGDAVMIALGATVLVR